MKKPGQIIKNEGIIYNDYFFFLEKLVVETKVQKENVEERKN